MLSPLQLNPSTHRPTRTTRGPVPLRFGEIDKDYLDSYKEAISGIPDFGPDEKYGSTEYSKIYNKLKIRAQHEIDKIVAQVSPKEVAAFQKAKLLGPIEESSDEIFENGALVALRQGIITEEKVDACRNKLLPKTKQERANKPFETLLKEIEQELPPEQVTKFTKKMGLPPEQARLILLLLCAKYMQMRERDPKFKIWKETRPLLWRESKELMAVFPLLSPRRIQIGLDALAYTYIPNLPSGFFHSELNRIVSGRINTKVKTTDLLSNVIPKQYRRQEHHYYNPDFKDNEALKLDTKPLEVIEEANVLKNALLHRPIELLA